MKRRHKIVSLALVLALCLGLCQPALAADEDFTILDGLPADKIGPGGDGILIRYNGSGGEVVIPDGVTQIRDGAFSDCVDVTAVTIPDSVTWIGMYAFSGCTGLTSVTIPGSVHTVYYHAFSGCTGLTEVTIQKNELWMEVCGWAFEGCSSLRDITIQGGDTSISHLGVFDGCDPGLTIHSAAGGNVERYARGNGIPFVAIAEGGALSETALSVARSAFGVALGLCCVLLCL